MDVKASGSAGKSVSRTLTGPKAAAARYVAVLYRDEPGLGGNWGLLRSARITGPGA